jgi:hypothetical protein
MSENKHFLRGRQLLTPSNYIVVVESGSKRRAVFVPLKNETLLQNLQGRLWELEQAGKIQSWLVAPADISTLSDLLEWLKSFDVGSPDVRKVGEQ